MATKKVIVVFVLPVIFSVGFGTVVMADILDKPGRELNMMPGSFKGGGSSHSESIEIIGLSKQNAVSEPIEIQVMVNDSSFKCGDLYITIYSSGQKDVVTQGGFFEQCYEENNPFIPIDERFSKSVDTPGSYEIEAQMISEDLSNTSTSEVFTVK